MVKIDLAGTDPMPIFTLLMFSILFSWCSFWLRLYIRTFCERRKNYFAYCAIYFGSHGERGRTRHRSQHEGRHCLPCYLHPARPHVAGLRRSASTPRRRVALSALVLRSRISGIHARIGFRCPSRSCASMRCFRAHGDQSDHQHAAHGFIVAFLHPSGELRTVGRVHPRHS